MFTEWCCVLSPFVFFLVRCFPLISMGFFSLYSPFHCISGLHLYILGEPFGCCEITVQVSFPHKCSQFSWCSELNVNVAITFLDISSFRCLHDSVVFLEALLSGVGSYLKYSQGVFAPRDPQSTNQSAFSPRSSHSQISSVSEWS